MGMWLVSRRGDAVRRVNVKRVDGKGRRGLGTGDVGCCRAIAMRPPFRVGSGYREYAWRWEKGRMMLREEVLAVGAVPAAAAGLL